MKIAQTLAAIGHEALMVRRHHAHRYANGALLLDAPLQDFADSVVVDLARPNHLRDCRRADPSHENPTAEHLSPRFQFLE
jgi:hypothetical protein